MIKPPQPSESRDDLVLDTTPEADGAPFRAGGREPTTSGMTPPAFRTERLNVFRVDIKPNEDHRTRAVFLGFLNDDSDDFPFVAVTATVRIDAPYSDGHDLEMVETNDLRRECGLATEFWIGLERHLGAPVYGKPATPEGERLLRAVERLLGPRGESPAAPG